MIKVVLPSSFSFDSPVMSLIDVHSRGVDRSWLRKSAAVLTKEMRELRPEKGVTFAHLLALGDQEHYGLNRNGDGFPKAACVDYHDTFVKHANWFHNHKNKLARGDPDFGFVKYSAYNPDMYRVELVVGIQEAKDPDSIEKLANNEDIPVSMACTVPFDICTVCHNKASSRANYCDCLTKYATQVTDTGLQVGMINTQPDFFDISKVHRNADRIAFTLRKVAGVDVPALGVDMATSMGLVLPDRLIKDSSYIRRRDLLMKLSRMEKEVEGVMQRDPSMSNIAESLNTPCEHVPSVDDGDIGKMMGSLANARVSLPISDFLKLVTGGRFSEIEDLVPEAEAAVPTMFSDGAACPDSVLNGADNYNPLDLAPSDLINTIVKKMRGPVMNDESTRGKVLSITLGKQAGSVVQYKRAQTVTPAGRALAQEYAKYKLALLDKVANDFVTRLSVIQNFGLGG